MKRVLSLLSILLLLFSLTACGEWEDPQDDLYETLSDYFGTSQEKDVLPALTSFALPYLPGETVDPFTCNDGAQKTLGTLLYEGLFSLDPAFVPQPALAESWSCDENARTYTIVLRQGVLFSDGTELTARDVVYSLKRARNSTRYAARLAHVSSVNGSDYTVTIQLSRSNASFISLLDVPIVKYNTGGQSWPVGTGPYYYAGDTSDPHLAVSVNWWQQKDVPIKRIELVHCKDSDTMSYAFYAREIQLLMCDLTSTTTSNVYGSGTYTDAATTTMQFIGINTARAPLNDPALRAALGLGIDRQGCIDAFLLGHGLAAQFPISPQSPLYPGTLDVPYSPDNFDTAIANAGYADGGAVQLTLLVNKENSFKVDAAKRIAEDLSHHDLQISVKTLPWEQYLAALQSGNFDLYYGECRLTADWDLSSIIGSGGNLNYGSYSDADTDSLLDACMRSADTDRAAAFTALCSHLQEQAPILPICFKNVSVLLPSDAVETITPTAANPFYDLPEWNIDIQS